MVILAIECLGLKFARRRVSLIRTERYDLWHCTGFFLKGTDVLPAVQKEGGSF